MGRGEMRRNEARWSGGGWLWVTPGEAITGLDCISEAGGVAGDSVQQSLVSCRCTQSSCSAGLET